MPVSGIFDEWVLDYLGPFPISLSGNRYILVGVERLSHFPVAFPSPDITGISTVRHLKNLVAIFGIPAACRVDNATSFQNEKVRDMCSKYSVKLEFNYRINPNGWDSLNE
ncbi:Pro-Pol polyprotein [Zancudomyces culisetae]|uniref:Pro-Pol polyprotein n=1 Tax=Zancudomyces culisetae TaxID=1213189 RepID=A0A1R1PRY1_ZANCU|nr:Pro-Pol polyprotein [Zancudomyces culisetae]|eukprot:OMH83689.1 Pro-Pol polyprotein [Zancudomyces culisetae]